MQHRPPSLCQLASEWSGSFPPDGMPWQEKIDGFRALWLRDHLGKPRLFTRNGMPIEGVDHFTWRLEEMERAAGRALVFDGEFQVDGTLEATKAWCERGWKAGGNAGQMFLFDVLPLEDWRRGECSMPYHARRKLLEECAAAVDQDDFTWRPGSYGREEALPPLVLLGEGWAFYPHDVAEEVRRIWAKGGEGLMLKDAEAPYERKRTDAWLKVKRNEPRLRRVA